MDASSIVFIKVYMKSLCGVMMNMDTKEKDVFDFINLNIPGGYSF
jgi:hypothetical protein